MARQTRSTRRAVSGENRETNVESPVKFQSNGRGKSVLADVTNEFRQPNKSSGTLAKMSKMVKVDVQASKMMIVGRRGRSAASGQRVVAGKSGAGNSDENLGPPAVREGAEKMATVDDGLTKVKESGKIAKKSKSTKPAEEEAVVEGIEKTATVDEGLPKVKKSGKISKKSKSTKPAEEEVVVEDSAQKENKRPTKVKESGKIAKKSKSTKPAEEDAVVEDSAQNTNQRSLRSKGVTGVANVVAEVPERRSTRIEVHRAACKPEAGDAESIVGYLVGGAWRKKVASGAEKKKAEQSAQETGQPEEEPVTSRSKLRSSAALAVAKSPLKRRNSSAGTSDAETPSKTPSSCAGRPLRKRNSGAVGKLKKRSSIGVAESKLRRSSSAAAANSASASALKKWIASGGSAKRASSGGDAKRVSGASASETAKRKVPVWKTLAAVEQGASRAEGGDVYDFVTDGSESRKRKKAAPRKRSSQAEYRPRRKAVIPAATTTRSRTRQNPASGAADSNPPMDVLKKSEEEQAPHPFSADSGVITRAIDSGITASKPAADSNPPLDVVVKKPEPAPHPPAVAVSRAAGSGNPAPPESARRVKEMLLDPPAVAYADPLSDSSFNPLYNSACVAEPPEASTFNGQDVGVTLSTADAGAAADCADPHGSTRMTSVDPQNSLAGADWSRPAAGCLADCFGFDDDTDAPPEPPRRRQILVESTPLKSAPPARKANFSISPVLKSRRSPIRRRRQPIPALPPPTPLHPEPQTPAPVIGGRQVTLFEVLGEEFSDAGAGADENAPPTPPTVFNQPARRSYSRNDMRAAKRKMFADHDTGEDDDDSDQERAEQAELLKKKKRKKPNKTKQQKEMDQWAKMMASHFEDVQQFHLSFD